MSINKEKRITRISKEEVIMRRENIKPLDVFDFKGTFYEIGCQYGEACRERIKDTVELWVGMIKGYHPEADKKEMVSIAQTFLEPYKDEPDLLDQIKGIAEGSEVSFEEIVLIQVAVQLVEYFPKLRKLGGCTSFAATGEATKNGETIIGQNWDWVPGSEPILIRVHPTKGPRFLGYTLPGMFTILGINSEGIGNNANLIVSTKSCVGVAPYGGVHQKVLQQKNLADSIGAICTTKRASADNFMMASYEGDIIDVETTQDDISVLYPEKGLIVHTNNFLTERFKSADLAAQLFPDSYLRVNRLTTLMEEHYGELSVEVMKKLLTDHNDYPDSICRHIDKEDPPETHLFTRASIISVPKEQKMYISNGNPCENEFVEYKL